MFRIRTFRPLVLALVGAAVACETPATAPAPSAPEVAASLAPSTVESLDLSAFHPLLAAGGGGLEAFIESANEELAARGMGVAIERAEWITAGPDADAQKIVFANNRTKLLPSRWVPGDPRRRATGTDLTQGSFAPLMAANGGGAPIAAGGIVDATFDTWNGVLCSDLEVRKVTFPPGVFPSAIFGLGGFVNDPLAADISTVGFLPGFIFDIVLTPPDADPDDPPPSETILGVTFTFVWVNTATRVPTDVDGNGRTDTALKEVWYNNAFTWSETGVGGIDIESVALHENGHSLEMGHFGMLTAHFVRGVFQRIQAAPRAVMNAAYIGVLREPLGTDNASYCENFDEWPD